MVKQTVLARLALCAALLALVVVGLGAYTRLTDSGLGCPDWPGCYGKLVVPSGQPALEHAQQAFPQQVLETGKAWKEMVHRYAAGTLGLLIVVLSGLLGLYHWQRRQWTLLPLLLILLLASQAALGMWTVTWQLLPLVVMGHLLGGLLLLSLLWLVWLRMRSQRTMLPHSIEMVSLRCWAFTVLCVVLAQIMLGGWTSANYAALACPDFPLCHGTWLPELNFRDAFNLFAPIGRNYAGGHLDSVGRVTIQFVHRVGGVVTFLSVLLLVRKVYVAIPAPCVRRLLGVMTALLVLQVILGMINAMYLPLVVAVSHNVVAALLLLTLLTLNHYLFARNDSVTLR